MSSTYTTLVGAPPNPATDYHGWRAWAERLIALRDAGSPSARSNNYYFAQSGDDANGSGTQNAPWKSLEKAQEIADIGETDTGFWFKRGDTWDEPTGTLHTSAANVTIGAYGAATAAKPTFTRFTTRYTSGWTLAAGNRYTRSEANDVAWVREAASPFKGFARATSAANCEATGNSFWYDPTGDILHLNLDGTDPNTLTMEAVLSNSQPMFRVSGDGSRIENVIVHGCGMHRTTNATQAEGVQLAVAGTASAVAADCECYYSNTHLISHYNSASSGGFATFLRCTGGFCSSATDYANIFNGYARDGGCEHLYKGCTARYGQLRDMAWYNASTLAKKGRGFNAHVLTGGTFISLRVNLDPTISAGDWSCVDGDQSASLPAAATIGDARSFVDGLVQELTDFNSCNIASGNQVRMNCRYNLKPHNTALQALTTEVPSGWEINCQFAWDMTRQTASPCGFYNTTVTTNAPKLWGCHFKITNCAVTFSIDRDNNGATGAPGSGGSSNDGELKNCILEAEATGAGIAYVGFNNLASQQTGNVYRGFTASTAIRGFSNDARGVVMSGAWDLGKIPRVGDAPYRTGTPALVLSADIRGFRRSSNFDPSSGPVEAVFETARWPMPYREPHTIR